VDAILKGTTGDCRILAGDVLGELPKLVGNEALVVVTDSNVRRLHAGSLPRAPIVEIGLGESSKTLQSVEQLYQRFLEIGLERDSWVVAVGGGIVCDVAAFAAATWLRGVRVGLLPTTLLAQSDAGVGGKNGVNFAGLKNQIGTVRQPRFVLCDPRFLKTLPLEELRNGLAEVVKSAAIADANLFDFLEANAEALLRFDAAALGRAVADSLAVKLRIVGRDELETGERRLLNFGHTLGHAIEASAGVRHGEGVAVGMSFAARLSEKRGLLATGIAQRLEALLARVGLPTRWQGEPAALTRAIARDKKRAGSVIHMALLARIGEGRVEPVEIVEIESALSHLR
jgi:3-dehydroquinate synthase